RRDKASSPLGLCHDEGPLCAAFRNRITDVFPARYFFPVGVDSARCLRPAFQHVADKTAGGQQVVVGGPPVELVHQNAEGESTVGATARDDNVCPLVQRSTDRQGAKVGVGGQHFRRELPSRMGVPHVGGTHVREKRHDVIASDNGDAERQSQLGRYRL